MMDKSPQTPLLSDTTIDEFLSENRVVEELEFGEVPREISAALEANGFQRIRIDGFSDLYYASVFEPRAKILCHAIREAVRLGLIVKLEHRIRCRLQGNEHNKLVLLVLETPPGIGPHEGQELKLMLAGKKHVALFDSIPKEFARHIKSGWLTEIATSFGSRIVYVSGCAEQANELLNVVERAARSNMEEALERRIGQLLGYSNEEIDKYIEHIGFRLKAASKPIKTTKKDTS